MFETSNKIIKSNFTYFLLIIFTFYVFTPYVLYLSGDFFLNNILTNFPEISHEKDREYVKFIYSSTNFHLVFFLNSILFALISLFFLKLIGSYSQETKNNFYHDKILLILNFLLFVCVVLLIIDFYELFLNLKEKSDLVHRSNAFQFINGRRQTHIVLGIIFSIYLIKNNKLKMSSIFLFLITCFEIYTLSRFYIFLFSVTFLVFSKRRYFVLLSTIIVIIITYRLILLGTFEAFLYNIFWEPISLWCTEIVKIQNLIVNMQDKNFINNFLFQNFFQNPLFLNTNQAYYIFKEETFVQFGSYANMGLIEILAFPFQTLILIISALIIKNKLNEILNLNDLIIILSCFCIFKILRGSAIYGLAFFVKTEILIGIVIFIIYLLKKLNFFKSSS